MPSVRTDVAWGDEAISSQDGNASSNIDNFGIEIAFRGFSVASDPLLKDCTYEQLLSEIARRNLDIQEEVTFELVKETYRIEKELGKGVSGVVHLVFHKGLRRRFACKVIEKNGPVNDLLSMTTEVEIMKKVRHPRIVSLFEIYESPKCMWMILELVDAGGLRGKRNLMHSRFGETVALRLIKQILEGLSYLHNEGIVHRDIKVDNILYQGDVRTGSIKIADFGLSAIIKGGTEGYPSDPLERKKYKALKATWGTPTHYSPELTYGAYGPQTDMWSLGCVVYEMLTGLNAFPPSSYLNHVSLECRDFLDKLLKVDPVVRMSANEALQHPWILSAKADGTRTKTFSQKYLSLSIFSCMRSSMKFHSNCLDAKDGENNENENENQTGSVSVQSVQSEGISSLEKRIPSTAPNSASKIVKFADGNSGKYCKQLSSRRLSDADVRTPDSIRKSILFKKEKEKLRERDEEFDEERPKTNKMISFRDESATCQVKNL